MEENRRPPPMLPWYNSTIPAENWAAGEDPIREVLNCVYPTLDSEEKRKDVIEYVQKLLRCSLGVEVFAYGSVPLKTYLPDGDIDMTVLSVPNKDDLLPRKVLSILQSEEQKENTEFELKDVQFIDAEVKLVKCVIQDIVIDVSFNQLGGLCALGFLEQVDRVIGKDHLFKRSIMLIKTWCYYESRILGAHHGLISTYALETLVLYIFHMYGAYLTSPLMVLYLFLDYYSNFDWDNYCISLDGAVTKAFLPKIVVEYPVNQGNGGFLSAEFLKNCVDMFMVPSKLSETNVRDFPMKYLNIIDPLKETNNVGRSVHRGNYYRIRSAFRYGASKLAEVLESSSENVGDGIKKFFVNTLQTHKSRYVLGTSFCSSSASSFSEPNFEDENADFDDYISGIDDGYASESLEVIDLSAFRSLSLTPANELADGDTNSMENYFLDFGKPDAIGGIGDPENLNPLADLTGDYDSHVRSLLYGQCCHGYALSSDLIQTSPSASVYGGGESWEVAANPWEVAANPSEVAANPWEVAANPLEVAANPWEVAVNPTEVAANPWEVAVNPSEVAANPSEVAANSWEVAPIPWEVAPIPWEVAANPWSAPYQSSSLCPPQMNPTGAVTRHAPYLAGQNIARAGEPVHWDERNPGRGTGPYFPVMNSPRGRGKHRGPFVAPRHYNWGRRRAVQTNRRSEASHEGPDPGEKPSQQAHGQAGSARPVTTPRKLEFGSFGPVPKPTPNAEASRSYVVNGRRPGRNRIESSRLRNEDEFPPLSA